MLFDFSIHLSSCDFFSACLFLIFSTISRASDMLFKAIIFTYKMSLCTGQKIDKAHRFAKMNTFSDQRKSKNGEQWANRDTKGRFRLEQGQVKVFCRNATRLNQSKDGEFGRACQ